MNSQRTHQGANGKETALCSKDITFTFTLAHSHFSFLPKAIFYNLHGSPQPLSHQPLAPRGFLCSPEVPQVRKPLCTLWEHSSMDYAGTRAALLSSWGLLWVTVPLNLPWHLNPFKISPGALNDSHNPWRTHTLEHMAHVLTKTVDNVSNDAPQCTRAGLPLQRGDQCRPGLCF